MARQQTPQQFLITPVDTTPQAFSGTEILCTSVLVQNPISSTDYIRVGYRTTQLFEIAPGKELSIWGDNLDNGTSAYTDLQDWFIVAASGSQSAVITYLAGY